MEHTAQTGTLLITLVDNSNASSARGRHLVALPSTVLKGYKKKGVIALLYPSLQCQTLPFLIFPFDSLLGLSFTQL